ncbi:LptF/LptG family permease [Synechococcus sp. OH30]|uniref:LptF/LptG family permease n=1 Tax=Synechococcus sp. OH30 TaxID=139352 RepID=UPI0039C24794
MARLFTKFWLLERYLFGQMLTPLLAGLAGGTLLLLAGRLFTLAERLVEGSVPPLTVLQLLMLDLPEMVVLGMPIAAFFATLLTLGNLSGNSEITAMRAAGIPFTRIFRPLLLVGLLLSLSAFLISNVLLPASKREIRRIDQQALLAQATSPVQYDVFFKTTGVGGTESLDNLWFFIRQVDPRLNTMQDVTILRVDPLPGGKYRLAEVTLAAQAVWNGLDWTLSEGVTHHYGPDGLSLAEEPFDRKPLAVSQDLAALLQPPVPPNELSLPELAERISRLARSNLDTQALRTEFHMRFSLPLASFFAVLISLPLGSSTARRVGRYGGAVLGILLVFAYYVVLSVSRSLGEAGALPPWVAAWSFNLLFGGLGLLLLARFLR